MPRSVLVTGGNRGIGLAVARAFAAAGDRVTIGCRSGELPPDAGLPPGAPVVAVPCDVTDAAQVDAAVKAAQEAHGPVQVLVANAGITRDRLVARMSDEDFDAVVNTNLDGVFRCVRGVCDGMLEARQGRIVLVSSVVGMLGAAGQANYAASKAGLVGLARSVARELGPRGITCNVVSPGPIETDMTEAITAKRRDQLTAQVPLGRFGAAGGRRGGGAVPGLRGRRVHHRDGARGGRRAGDGALRPAAGRQPEREAGAREAGGAGAAPSARSFVHSSVRPFVRCKKRRFG